MVVKLPVLWLVVANVLGWLAIHMAVAWAGTRIPDRIFNPRQWWWRTRRFERNGRLYERAFSIRAWKDRLPDGAALFRGGFKKARLATRDATYLERFVRETCRGEAVHWVVLASSALFFIWNPWWAGLLMVGYAVAVNIPCIFAQRYNRIRLARVLGKGRR